MIEYGDKLFQHTLRPLTKIWSKILKNSSEITVKLYTLWKELSSESMQHERKIYSKFRAIIENCFDRKSKCFYIIFWFLYPRWRHQVISARPCCLASSLDQKFWWKISIASLFQIKSMKQLEKGMLSHKSLRSYDPLSVVITKHMQSLLISNDYLLLNTFLAVAVAWE